MFDNLRSQILGNSQQKSSLARHLIFHETYKRGGILDNFYSEYDADNERLSLSDRQRYIEGGLADRFSGDISDKVGDALLSRSIESELNNESSIGDSGIYRLKSVIGAFESGAREAADEEQDIDAFVGNSLFKGLFGSEHNALKRLNGGIDHYSYYGSSESNVSGAKRALFSQIIPAYNYDDVGIYMRGQNRVVDQRRAMSGSFGYSLDSKLEAANRVDRTVYNTRYELARLKGRSYGDYSPQHAIDYLQSLMEGRAGYLNKPGIAPIVSVIESSNSFLDMDMFQFQNETIGDMYFNKIIENTSRIISTGDDQFKVRIRVAGNDEGSQGATGFSILGPNIIQMQRLAGLRERMVDELASQLQSKGEAGLHNARDIARARVYKNFQIVETDRKNHRKLLINERLAVVGSANFTQPLGSSLYQEGSTYEAVRILTKMDGFERVINPNQTKQEREKALENFFRVRALDALKQGRIRFGNDTKALGEFLYDENEKSQHEIISSKLYMQAARLNEKIQNSPHKKLMTSGERNIGLSHDIWMHMKETLTYAERDTTTQLKMMLDQPFILQFSDSPFQGEMGKDTSLGSLNRDREYRRHIQDRIYRLIKADRADFVVDIRNYRDRVIDPTYKAVREVLGTQFDDRYERNLENLIDLSQDFDTRETRLKDLFGSTGFDFSTLKDFSNMEQLVRQVMVITSGNISLSTQPKQHLKSYGLFDKVGGLISYYMGSSNLGPGSVSMFGDGRDKDIANQELGLLLSSVGDINNKFKSRSPWDLEEQESMVDLRHSTTNFTRQWNTLTGSSIKQNVNTRPSWEKDVDTQGVERLAANLREINEAVGFDALRIEYLLGGSSGSKRIGLNVEFNTSSLTGLSNAPSIRYKFAPLKYARGDNRGGFVYAIDQGKAIGRARFVNSRARDNISMPFGIGEDGYIDAQSAATLDAVQNTSIRMATLVGELVNKSMVEGPKAYLQSKYGDNSLSSTFMDYMEWLATGKQQGGSWLMNASESELEALSYKLRQRLDSTGNGALTKVREFTGTNTSEVNAVRHQHLEYVTAMLDDMKFAKQHERYNILSLMSKEWSGNDLSIWQDLALDMISSHNDYGYENFIRQQIRNSSKYMLEDTVTQGKQSAYIGPQGYNKLSLLGVTDSPQYNRIHKVSSNTTGIGRIFEFARFSPLTYGPTTEMFTPGAFRSVAEGGGSRPSSDAWSGITMFGMNKQELGNLTDIEALNFMGVGFTTTKGEIEDYLSTIVDDDILAGKLAEKVANSKDRDSKLATYLFSPKKISQIPQRLKNVMGSQAMHVISPQVTSILESQADLPSYLDHELASLREQVATAISNITSVPLSQAQKKAEALIDDSYVNSFIIGSGIRKVLGAEASRIVEAEKQGILEDLGLDVGDINGANRYDPLVQQLLRAKLINRDVLSPGVKGFTGHMEGTDQITLLQLGGAHSDYFYANPVYGGDRGLREGFIDRQEKRLKASMLSNNWTDASNTKIIAWEGDYVSYDKDSDRVIVVHGNKSNKPGKISSYRTEVFSPADLDKGRISSMGVRDIFKDVADNARGVSGESSFATYTGATWFSDGEDSIEYTLSSKWLNADPEGNQSVFELMLLRSKKGGGGTRYEAFGSLFKGVSYFVGRETIQHVLDSMKRSVRPSGLTHSMDWRDGRDINIHNVLGIAGPSHLKSYSFEHGANILLDDVKRATITNHNDSDIAMGLLLGFGTGFLEARNGVSSNIDNIRIIKSLMYERAISGQLGDYNKELATKATLASDFDRKLNKAASDYIKRFVSNPSLTPEALLSNERYRKELVAQVVSDDLMSKTNFSMETTPDLLGITSEDIIRSLNGNSNLVKTKINKLVSDVSSVAKSRGHLLYTDFKERSAINIIAALDINAQLSSQMDMRGMPTDVDLSDDKVLMQIASIAGDYSLGRMAIDEEYKEEVKSNIRGLLSTYKVIGLYSSIGFSQSKVAMGKKFEANLELQYMIKPFLSNFKMLRGGGKLEHIKKAVATIYKATSVSNELLVGDIEANMPELNIRPFQSLEFTSYGTKETLGKARFLSVYGGSSNLSQLSMYKRKLMEIGASNRQEINKTISKIKEVEIQRQASLSKGDKDQVLIKRNELSTLYSTLQSLLSSNGTRINDVLVEEQLKNMARVIESDSDKGFGTGQAKNFLDAMEVSGQRSFMFSLPSIAGTEYTQDGKIRLKFDYESPISVFMPDSQMLKNLGVEFGSYIADELKSTMILSSAFAPGTTMSLIRDQMAFNYAKGQEDIIVAKEDLSRIEQYWSTASAMTEMLALSSSGTISKRAFAGENRMAGLVSTAAASFLVPEKMALVAKAGLKRHGLSINPSRERAIKTINSVINTSSKQKRTETKEVFLENLRTQAKGLARGVSPEGTRMLTSVRQHSQFMRGQIDQLERIGALDRGAYRKTLAGLIRRNKQELRKVSSHQLRGSGDQFADLAAKQELQYWSERLTALSLIGKGADNSSHKAHRTLKSKKRLIKEMEAAPWMISGFSIGSRFKVKGNIAARLEIEDLENSLRGRAGINSWDEDYFRSITTGDMYLSDRDKDALFINMVEKTAGGYTNLAEAYKREYGLSTVSSSKKDNADAYTDLLTLGREIQSIADDFKNRGSSNKTITRDDAISRLNRILSRLDTSDLAQAFITRSSPPGGTEHQRQMFRMIRSVSFLNERAEKASSDDYHVIRTDKTRNSTLTLLSPLSQVTMALGDFDGDPYTIIFSGLRDMSEAVEKLDNKQTAIDLRIASLERKVNKFSELIQESSGNEYMDQFLSVWGTKRNEASIQIENLKRSKASLEDKKLDYLLKIQMSNEMMDPNKYNKAVRKEVANYMGLRSSVFQGNTSLNNEDGGIYSLIDVDLSILPTLIEQGSGLFSGLEDQGSSINRLQRVLGRIVEDSREWVNDGTGVYEMIRVRNSRESISLAIDNLARVSGPDKTLYTTMSMMGDLKNNIIDQIEEQFIIGAPSTQASMAVDEYRQKMASLSTSIYQSVSGLKEAQSKIGQGAGITLEYTTYDFLTKVLGKAGGDLLGKTYNTLIGTLYSDTPLLALGHIFEADDNGSSARSTIERAISNREGGAEMISHIRETSAQAASTQGFLKNIHQLLRDSIKFKKEGGDLKETLERKARQYSQSKSVEERDKLITEMTSFMGPGPGLSALMNLNTLIVERDSIKDASIDPDQLKEYLSSTFGMATFGAVDESGSLVQSKDDAFTKVFKEYQLVTGRKESEISLLDVVNYKVGEDLKSLVSAYRFEKYVGESGSPSKADRLMSYKYLERNALISMKDQGSELYHWMRSNSIINPNDDVDVKNLELYMNREYKSGHTVKQALDTQIELDLDAWYRSLPANKKRRIRDISDSDFNDLSTDQRGMLRLLIDEEDDQTSKWLGKYGEGLNRFATLSQVRMNSASLMSGDTTSLSNQFQEADVAMTMLNLATQDKLSARAQSLFFNEMVRSAGIGITSPKREQFSNEEEYKQAKDDYEKELKIQILKRVSGIPTTGSGEEGSSSLFNGVSTDKRDNFVKALDNFLSNELSIAIPTPEGTKIRTYESGIEFISYQLEETAAGQRSSMLRSIINSNNAVHKEDGLSEVAPDIISLAEGILKDPNDMESLSVLMSDLGKLGLDGSHPAAKYKQQMFDAYKQYDDILKKDIKLVDRESAKAARNSNALDIVAPLALTLLGGAVIEGGITEDMLGQVAGASFMTLAYSKQGFAKKSSFAVTGSAFRLSNAIAQAGDEDEGFKNYVLQESAFMLGSLAVAPFIQSAVDHTIARSISPHVKYKDAMKRSLNPLAYSMKSGAVLDMDKFGAAKAVSGSVSGAILSAVIGMTMGSVVGEMVAAPKKIRTGTAIDMAIEGLSNTIQRATNYRLEAELNKDVLAVTDEDGIEYIDNEKEVTATEQIWQSAIDPMEDVHYIYGVPGFVTAGVSIGTEEQY